MKITKAYLKELTYEINGAAIEVHKELGPGLLESIYHQCLEKELSLRGIRFQSEFSIPIFYKGHEMNVNLRCDLFIEDVICVELKTVEKILPVHEAQLMTYMKLLESPKGIIYNFKVANLYRDGQTTRVNDLFRDVPD